MLIDLAMLPETASEYFLVLVAEILDLLEGPGWEIAP